MIKLRDHYFIAWLKVVKQKEVKITSEGIFVNINKTEYNQILKEYNESLKPVLTEIRKTIKELASLSTNSKNSIENQK